MLGVNGLLLYGSLTAFLVRLLPAVLLLPTVNMPCHLISFLHSGYFLHSRLPALLRGNSRLRVYLLWTTRESDDDRLILVKILEINHASECHALAGNYTVKCSYCIYNLHIRICTFSDNAYLSITYVPGGEGSESTLKILLCFISIWK